MDNRTIDDKRKESGIILGEKTPTLHEAIDWPIRRILPHLQYRFAFQTHWLGARALKNPFDAWVYQEIIYETKPDIIIEIGCFQGGGALYLAHLCDLMDHGRVLGLDREKRVTERAKKHSRIEFIFGDSTDEAIIAATTARIQPGERVMVIEDSDHRCHVCLAQLRAYSKLVTPGCYYIVEDTIHYNGTGLDIGPNPGSASAVDLFLMENNEFEVDRGRENLIITWCPGTFLRKKS